MGWDISLAPGNDAVVMGLGVCWVGKNWRMSVGFCLLLKGQTDDKDLMWDVWVRGLHEFSA